MTRIKLCGLSRLSDINAANEIKPEYIGFVFVPGSRRYIAPGKAAELKQVLDSGIKAVGVFADERIETVAGLFRSGTIDMVQLHGRENEEYINRLKKYTGCPVIQAVQIRSFKDAEYAKNSAADYILLDSGAGTGTVFNWKYIHDIQRPYFLAGGLSPDNAEEAVRRLHPFALDVSSGIETDGKKDTAKMAAFAAAARKGEE